MLASLPPGFVRLPNVVRFNRRLLEFGLEVEIVTLNCNAGLPFGRRSTDPDYVAEVRRACREVVDVFGLPDVEVQTANGPQQMIPLTAVGFSPLGDMPNDKLVAMGTGPGFMPDENPHPECLGLVMSYEQLLQTLLANPFTDAPGAIVAYAGFDADGEPFLDGAAIMGLWHRLPHGLVRRTLNKLAEQVESRGVTFDMTKVWVFITPAASEEFELKGDRDQRLSPKHRDMFLHEEDGKKYLNLRGWFHHLFLELGVPIDQIGMLNHDTVTSTCYSSKRARIGMRRALPDDVLPSNAIVLHLRIVRRAKAPKS